MKTKIIPQEIIRSKILFFRGTKVMLDSDLAKLYEVPTFRLNEAVKRNKKRFPDDFVFQLTTKECQNLISQSAISSWGGKRKPPYVFTEHGIMNNHRCRTEAEYEKIYGKDVILSQLGKITIVHTDRPSKETIEKRINEVIREELRDEAYEADCPLCQMTKDDPCDVVYTGDDCE